MAKSNIRKKQIDFLIVLKLITKWITNKKRNDAQLQEIIDRYKIENTIIKRILSYNYSFPYIINYYNMYFNNLYDFDKFDTKTLIKSITYLMDINHRSESKYFIYIKSNELKDEIKSTIKDLIKEYLSVTYDIVCNKKELNFYYKLFKIGYITDEDLLLIDRHLNGENTKIKSLQTVNFNQAINITSDIDVNDNIEIEMSEKIIDFINEIKQNKISNNQCKNCNLFKSPIVVLDTNSQDFGDIDIMFVGLNPGVDEVKQDKPFVGDSGKEIRKIIKSLPNNVKWLITNTILCSTGNKKDIKDIDSVKENCKNMTEQIFSRFNAKYYIPVGDDACKFFGIDDKITLCSGKIFEVNENQKIIPIIHPSAVLRSGQKYQQLFNDSVKTILDCFQQNKNVSSSNIKSKTLIPEDKLVNDTKNLLFVDVKRISNNQILMIYTDLAGKKKYKIEEYKIPIYIKNKNWTECSMITDKIDDTCLLNDYEKSKLSQKCHQIIKDIN